MAGGNDSLKAGERNGTLARGVAIYTAFAKAFTLHEVPPRVPQPTIEIFTHTRRAHRPPSLRPAIAIAEANTALSAIHLQSNKPKCPRLNQS